MPNLHKGVYECYTCITYIVIVDGVGISSDINYIYPHVKFERVHVIMDRRVMPTKYVDETTCVTWCYM